MTATQIHSVTPEERLRATAIENWLCGYPSAESRRSMESSLRAIVRAARDLKRDEFVNIMDFGWEYLDHLDIFEAIAQRLTERYGRQHASKYVIAMRALLKSLARSDLVNYGAAQRVLSGTKVRQTRSEFGPLSFSTDDVWRVLRQCKNDPNQVKGLRDLCLISMTASTGARRSEIVRVELTDVNFKEMVVLLSVKGGGTRYAALHHSTKDHLDLWLEVRGEEAGPLFPALRRGGHLGAAHVSDFQFWKLLGQRCERAGIDAVIAPHDLRRWFVSSLLDARFDVFQVARAVGHARVETTFRYDRRSQDRLREVVDSLNLPGLADLNMDDEQSITFQ
jgi:integrase